MSDPLLTGFDLQLIVTGVLFLLSWYLYHRLEQREFFRWWTWGWGSVGLFMVAFRLAMTLGSPDVMAVVQLLVTPLVLMQAPLFLLGAESLRRGERIPKREVTAWIGGFALIGVVFGLLAANAASRPELAQAYRGVVRQVTLAVVLPYSAWVFYRARDERTIAVILAAAGLVGYGMNQAAYGVGAIGHLLDVHLGISLGVSDGYLTSSAAYILDIAFEAAIGLGAALLLIEEHEMARRALELSERRFRNAFRNAPIGMALLSPEGRLLRTNRVLREMLGRNAAALEGQPITRMLSRLDSTELESGLARLAAGDIATHQAEYALWTPSGSTVYTVIQASLAEDREAGRQFILQIQDVTERRALERAQRRLTALVDASSDFIALADSDGVRYLNPAGLRMLGFDDLDDVLGVPLLQLVHPEDRAAVGPSVRAALDDGGPWTGEARLQGRDDTAPVPVLANTFRVHDEGRGESTATATICRDISEIKRTQLELEKAKELAEAANRAKSEFLATMSHEIRTPMNAIIGMAELLAETDMTAQQADYVQVFRTAGETLLTLINEVLDLSKLEAGRLSLDERPFDLRELVERAVELYAVPAHKKGVEIAAHIEPDTPTWVHGDPDRLRQVLVNLIGNAVKFTDEGEVVVDVGCGEHDAGDDDLMLRFSVRDTGVGIPEEKRDTIFQRFTQADSSTTRQFGGTGLGLTISREIVSLMGGEIGVESEVGVGSTFRFTIRLAEADRAERDSMRRVDADDLTGIRVLVVDDNATNRLILGELLEGWGMRSVDAPSGEEALAALREAKKENAEFELVLLDGHMPGMDGFDVAREIRRDPDLTDVTTMMLSSGAHQDDIRRVKEMGIQHYMMKPIRRSRLLDAIREVVGASRADGGLSTASNTPTDPAELPPLRLLLVDDAQENRMLVQAYLEKSPVEITTACNGEEAVEAFTADPDAFDLVLMDIRMPVMDGYEATTRIRTWEREQGREPVTIMALTAHALAEERQRTREAGCDAHLTKPIKKGKLIETLSRFAGEQRAELVQGAA